MAAILDLAGRPWVRTLALIASILALASLLWQSDEPREPTAAADLRGATEPDGFVVNGRYLAFNEAGQLTSHIESPRIEQFESTRLATMMAPEATLYDETSGVPWTLRADNGRFTEGTDIVELEGNVVLTRPLGGGRDATLTTEQLTVDNRNRTVYTDEPVEMTDRYSVTRATGMKAWIDERILELESQVEGRYEPAKRNTP